MADRVVDPSEFAAVPHLMIKQFKHHEIRMTEYFRLPQQTVKECESDAYKCLQCVNFQIGLL